MLKLLQRITQAGTVSNQEHSALEAELSQRTHYINFYPTGVAVGLNDYSKLKFPRPDQV